MRLGNKRNLETNECLLLFIPLLFVLESSFSVELPVSKSNKSTLWSPTLLPPGDSTCGQRAIYHGLGLSGIPIMNVNNNCSTGSTALFMARQLVQGGKWSWPPFSSVVKATAFFLKFFFKCSLLIGAWTPNINHQTPPFSLRTGGMCTSSRFWEDGEGLSDV